MFEVWIPFLIILLGCHIAVAMVTEAIITFRRGQVVEAVKFLFYLFITFLIILIFFFLLPYENILIEFLHSSYPEDYFNETESHIYEIIEVYNELSPIFIIIMSLILIGLLILLFIAVVMIHPKSEEV